MKKYSIEVYNNVITVRRVSDDEPEKIFNTYDHYFEVGEFENIGEANEKARKIKSLPIEMVT